MMLSQLIPFIATGGPSMSVPGPYVLFTLLHWLTLTLHFVAMNFLFGGVMLMIISKTSPYRKLLFAEKLQAFPTSMAATVTLGVAPLLFLQVIYGKFFYSATVISGVNWFLVVPVAIAVYYLLYMASMKENLSDSSRVKLLIGAFLGMLYISLTLTTMSDLASKPYLWAEMYKACPGGWSLNPSWGQTIFRWLHIVTGALAVGGIVIQVYTLYHSKVKGNRDLMNFGGKMFLMGTLKATIFAIIYLFTLEPMVLIGFLASPGFHVILAAVVLNIVIVWLVFKTSTSMNPRPLIFTNMVLTFMAIFLMVMTRHYLRLVFLEGEFDPTMIATQSQTGPMIMFLVTFVIGLVVLFWMLKVYFGKVNKAQND